MSVVGNLEILESAFRWKIENFSSIKTAIGVPVFSPMFRTTHHCEDLQWQLQFYPGGFNEGSKEYMGLCITYLGECQVSVFYSLFVVDDKHNKVSEFTCEKETAFKKNETWGCSRFILKTIIHDETKHALINDTLLISCTIIVRNTALNDEHYDVDNSARAHFEKLLESGDLSDVTFEVGPEKMRLPKAIVASLSPVFFAMFQHKMKEGEEGVVRIPDVKYEVMKELLRYIYVRKVNNIESIAGDLFVAADKYDVQGLKILCENVLIKYLNVDNALQHLEFAVKYNTASLKSKVIEFVASRLEEFVDRLEFKQMSECCKDELLCAMARNKLKTSCK